jgi:hypothetical protein
MSAAAADARPATAAAMTATPVTSADIIFQEMATARPATLKKGAKRARVALRRP